MPFDKRKSDSMTENEKSFEENLNDLENIVISLEQGDLSLEDAMSNYENGVNLTKLLNQKIENSKLKIKEMGNENG